MIKTELSSCIARKIGQLVSKVEPSNYKIFNPLVLPMNKLKITEDYATEELLLSLLDYI
jgi:hypothetical protein